MRAFTFNRHALEAFARTWPCMGLPDAVDAITFEFDQRGDLVDLFANDGQGEHGRQLPQGWDDNMDGGALIALSQDAKEALGL